MPKEFERTRRVGEQIQRELAVLIQQELKDPRLGMLTISAVEVSKDMGVAKVFITVFNEAQDRAKTLEALFGTGRRDGINRQLDVHLADQGIAGGIDRQGRELPLQLRPRAASGG